MDFTEQEVKQKLEELVYHDVPRSKLLQFMTDLDELIQLDLSGVTTLDGESSGMDDTGTETLPLQDITMKAQPKAFAKEKIKTSMDHISFDKENMSILDSTGYSDCLSSTLTVTENDNTNDFRDCSRREVGSGMRRKVSRKRDGSSRIFDESTTNDENELSDITVMEEKLKNLPLRENQSIRSHSSASNSQRSRPKSESSLNLEDATLLPSFIRPTQLHPHTKNLRKCDPVSRYQQFQNGWKHNKVPGESSHSNTRWNVREQMLYCEVFEKPQHQHNVNKYVVPTEKKRQALRWQVRNAMARM